MDVINLYRLGQIRQQEIAQDAEAARRTRLMTVKQTLWQRIILRLTASQPPEPAHNRRSYQDTVALSR